jgi:membrane-associated phospholipid phosphatase
MGLGQHEVSRFLFLVKSLVMILISGIIAVHAIGQNTDSNRVCVDLYDFHRPLFLLPPTVLIGTGLMVQNTVGFPVSSDEVRTFSQDLFNGRRTHVDDYLQFAPLAAVGGLRLAGIPGKHSMKDEAFLYAVSLGIQGCFVLPLKAITNVERPDGSARNSMPSGHTASAFAAATFMYMEYKDKSPWYGIAAYTCASAVGSMRMINNRHWLSDVLVGAGIGIISTRLSYYLLHRVRPVNRSPWIHSR